VDDDPEIVRVLGDILASLNHEYDAANSVEAARQLVEREHFDYYLIDLQIPVHSGHGLARIQNGENLIDELIGKDASRGKRIIAITAHGNDAPIQPVEMMKKGIADYIPKPFEETGKTLDKAILEMLSRLGGDANLTPLAVAGRSTSKLTRFAGGTMLFYADRVELCGVDICSGTRSKRRRAALDLLRLRSGNSFAAYGGEALARKIGLRSGQNGAAGLIRDLRGGISEMLRTRASIDCHDEDVILSGGPGYRFSERLTVRDGQVAPVEHDHGQGQDNHRNDVPNRVPDVPIMHVPNVPNEHEIDVRQKWILVQLQGGINIRAKDVMFEFGCCKKTALRDLQALLKRGKIEREGSRRNCTYRLSGVAKRA
jgi:CheY-like chemotaxis protein